MDNNYSLKDKMGGRGPPYWMKCLMCLAKIDEKSQFFIGIKNILA